MSSGPEHYRSAEKLLSQASFVASPDDPQPLTPSGNEMRHDVHHGLVARAQVHATLAHAAATALHGANTSTGLEWLEYDAWRSAAATKAPPQAGGEFDEHPF